MKTTTIIVLSFAFCLLQCLSVVSSKGVPGYILSTTKSFSTSLLKQSLGDAVYNDQDVKDLVLHNLGMLKQSAQLSDSSQDLISQFGNRNFFKQEKLNYVFLLEGASSQSLFQAEKKSLENSHAEHQAVLFDVCNGEDSNQCLLNQLFNTEDETSVVSSLAKLTKKDNYEAYVYSSDDGVSAGFPKATLTSTLDKKGNVYLLEQKSEGKFKVATSLQACVNSALDGKYTVDLEKRSITSKSNAESFVVSEDAKESFISFMTDICSIVGTSTLIRKDSNPSFFVFHINSIGKLEQSLSESQRAELYKIFNVAYDQFVSNLLARYTRNEISGQVLFLSTENNIKAVSTQDQLWSKRHHPWKRSLLESGQTTASQATSSTTTIIFGSVLVAFALITAWVCIEMFSIDVQKDSVVYAKFLAGDYFRR